MNNLSSERLDPGGVFLLDDGQYLLLWVGKAAAPEVVHALFGVPSLLGLDDAALKLTDQGTLACAFFVIIHLFPLIMDPFTCAGNEFSQRVMAIVSALRASHPCHQKLYVVREGDPLEVRSSSSFLVCGGQPIHVSPFPHAVSVLCPLCGGQFQDAALLLRVPLPASAAGPNEGQMSAR